MLKLINYFLLAMNSNAVERSTTFIKEPYMRNGFFSYFHFCISVAQH